MSAYPVLLEADQIRLRVAELGRLISADYGDKDLVVVGVLKGAFVFMADLVREVRVPLLCDFLRVSSYDGRDSSGTVRLEFDTSQPLSGKDVLLVEDIVDTGRTLRFLFDFMLAKQPASLRLCSLLCKSPEPVVRGRIDYLGFQIPAHYVVGYGLDDCGRSRSLNYIGYIPDN